MEGTLLLDIVVRKSTPVLELLSGKDQALLIRRNALLILNLSLDIVDRVARFHIESNRLSSEGLYENLHTTTETKNQMQGGLLLNVVVGESTSVLELLSRENETLLIRRNTLFVLDLGLDVIDSVRRLYIKSDSLSGKGLDEDLHTTTEAKHQVESRLLLDVVVRESAAILQLLSGEDKTLLIRRDSFFVLDLGLDVVNGIRGLDVQGDGLTSQSLDKDLHSSTETEDEVESRLFLDVVIREGATIFQLFTSKDQTLLIRRDSFLVLNLGLDIVNGIRRFDVEGNGLAGQGFDENLLYVGISRVSTRIRKQSSMSAARSLSRPTMTSVAASNHPSSMCR